MDVLTGESIVYLFDDGYDFSLNTIVFEDVPQHLNVYTIKDLLKFYKCEVQ